jgi:pimeloyl-ACP methyl ester carboxylesterase
VAHSFGALAAVQAASDHAQKVAGALLVAPADPESFGVAEFLPTKALGFPVIVIASTNDPWMAFDTAARWVKLWKADLVNLGDAGHINSESGFGPWPEGLALLERLRRAAEFRLAAERLAALNLVHARPARQLRVSRGRYFNRPRSNVFDRRDLEGAAVLLREAGWTVRAPVHVAFDAS